MKFCFVFLSYVFILTLYNNIKNYIRSYIILIIFLIQKTWIIKELKSGNNSLSPLLVNIYRFW